jgi:hypothetical protein
MTGRRSLTFASLDEVMPDVDRLLEGHTTVGRWSLGQICNHLAGALRGSVKGIRFRAPWLIRQTVGRLARQRVLKSGRMATGVKIPEEFTPRPGLDARAEAEALRSALRLFNEHSGPMAEHPFFGALSRAEWDRLHCIHCAHHLSFALPEDRA